MTQIDVTPGDATLSFVYDSFTYSLGCAAPASLRVSLTGDYDDNDIVDKSDYVV